MDLVYAKVADALPRDKKLLGIISEQKYNENLTFSDIPTSLPLSPMTTTTWLDFFHFYRNTWMLVKIVCCILALHMLSYISPPPSHTHTHMFDTLNTCVSNMNGRFLTMHHTDLIGHLTVSISLVMKPNNVWKPLHAETENWVCAKQLF